MDHHFLDLRGTDFGDFVVDRVIRIGAGGVEDGMSRNRAPKLGSNPPPPTSVAGPEPQRARSLGDVFLDAIVSRLKRRGALTKRMAEALELHVHGWPPDAAAREMRCSLSTYRNHMASAFRRIGVEAPSELFRAIALDLEAEAQEGAVVNLTMAPSPDRS